MHTSPPQGKDCVPTPTPFIIFFCPIHHGTQARETASLRNHDAASAGSKGSSSNFGRDCAGESLARILWHMLIMDIMLQQKDTLKRLIELTNSPSSQLKTIAAQNIKLYIKDFPELEDDAINAVYDLCEDSDQKVCT